MHELQTSKGFRFGFPKAGAALKPQLLCRTDRVQAYQYLLNFVTERSPTFLVDSHHKGVGVASEPPSASKEGVDSKFYCLDSFS